MIDDETVAELVRQALKAVAAAYAPYSHFQVGAAVLGASGRIFPGANVENASYGATSCAERNAVCNAVVAGERSLVAIAIAGGNHGQIDDYCPPCGICRQVLCEFADPKTFTVFLVKSETEFKACLLEDLLPRGFTSQSLG